MSDSNKTAAPNAPFGQSLSAASSLSGSELKSRSVESAVNPEEHGMVIEINPERYRAILIDFKEMFWISNGRFLDHPRNPDHLKNKPFDKLNNATRMARGLLSSDDVPVYTKVWFTPDGQQINQHTFDTWKAQYEQTQKDAKMLQSQLDRLHLSACSFKRPMRFTGNIVPRSSLPTDHSSFHSNTRVANGASGTSVTSAISMVSQNSESNNKITPVNPLLFDSQRPITLEIMPDSQTTKVGHKIGHNNQSVMSLQKSPTSATTCTSSSSSASANLNSNSSDSTMVDCKTESLTTTDSTTTDSKANEPPRLRYESSLEELQAEEVQVVAEAPSLYMQLYGSAVPDLYMDHWTAQTLRLYFRRPNRFSTISTEPPLLAIKQAKLVNQNGQNVPLYLCQFAKYDKKTIVEVWMSWEDLRFNRSYREVISKDYLLPDYSTQNESVIRPLHGRRKPTSLQTGNSSTTTAATAGPKAKSRSGRASTTSHTIRVVEKNHSDDSEEDVF